MTGYYDELTAHHGPEGAHVDGWRHRLEQWLRFEIVSRGLKLDSESRVVDLGCGTAQLLEYLQTCQLGHYVGVDLRSDVLETAKDQFHTSPARFVCANWNDPIVDEAGPYDFAVAIGTMVDGDISDGPSRKQQVEELISRLHQLGRRGWALVALDQKRLEMDPVRSMEPFLKGAAAWEVREIVDELGVEAVIDQSAVPTDLIVIHRRGEKPEAITCRVTGDEPHHAVLEDVGADGGVDRARRVWFWMTTGRLDKARQVWKSMPDSHLRKKLLGEQLRMREA